MCSGKMWGLLYKIMYRVNLSAAGNSYAAKHTTVKQSKQINSGLRIKKEFYCRLAEFKIDVFTLWLLFWEELLVRSFLHTTDPLTFWSVK